MSPKVAHTPESVWFTLIQKQGCGVSTMRERRVVAAMCSFNRIPPLEKGSNKVVKF